MVALSWAYLFAGAGMDMAARDMAGPMTKPEWTGGYWTLMAAMWAVMMVAMMLPSAAPMILLHAKVARQRTAQAGLPYATAMFMLAYVVVWTVFSLGATALHFALDRSALLSPMIQANSRALSGALLVVAGFYQITPLKHACLRRCRSPLDFVMGHWRPGAAGAFSMGLRHGAWCLGCCWALMLLLFVGGVMNLLWIAVLAGLVFVEKLVPGGPWFARGAGLLLVAWGAVLLA